MYINQNQMLMKKNFLKFVSVGLTCFCMSMATAQDPIRLIGFTSNGQTIDNLVKWNAGATNYLESNPVDYIGVLVGSSVYNSKNGEYYSRVLVSENDDYVSKMLKYRSQNNSFLLTEVTSFYNGSAEVDMQNGMLYSYDGDIDNNLYLNKYNPITQTSTNLGYYAFGENTFFFPDSSCYDSDAGIYYFIIQDGEGKKLVKSTIGTSSFTYNVIPIIGENIIGNIGLEYSNEENTIHLIYPEFNFDTGTSTMNVGKLNPETGAITNLTNIAEITGLQLFNRTYDQNSEKLIFIGIDLDNQQRLYAYNTLTSTLEVLPLPSNVLIEIEADNYEFAQARYNSLNTNELNSSVFTVSPNPAKDWLEVRFEGTSCDYEINDSIGKVVAVGTIQNGGQLAVSDLNKGVYFLNLKTTIGSENKKIIIQ